MPIYDFVCLACDHVFEERERIADRKKPIRKPCPACNKREVRQTLPHAPSIGDPVRLGLKKPDNSFQDRMKKIAKEHSPGGLKDKIL